MDHEPEAVAHSVPDFRFIEASVSSTLHAMREVFFRGLDEQSGFRRVISLSWRRRRIGLGVLAAMS
jgi:hypothetical protein